MLGFKQRVPNKVASESTSPLHRHTQPHEGNNPLYLNGRRLHKRPLQGRPLITPLQMPPPPERAHPLLTQCTAPAANTHWGTWAFSHVGSNYRHVNHWTLLPRGAADRVGSGPEERLLTDFNLGLMICARAPALCSRMRPLGGEMQVCISPSGRKKTMQSNSLRMSTFQCIGTDGFQF